MSYQLLRDLHSGAYDSALKALYALDGKEESLEKARVRAIGAAEKFLECFCSEGEPTLFTGPGRTELGGNHTDHQHGRVLCGSVDLDMLSCAAPNGQAVVHIWSEGYPPFEMDLARLEPVPGEEGTSSALTRGVCAGVAALGYPVGGFDAYITSNVLSGSGLSSSAAYEVLMGNILNRFFCGGALDAVTIAKVGQMAENKYFGKPCGLMDQMGSSVGGAVAIDFCDPAAPVVRAIPYDFTQSGHALCIIDKVSSHYALTDD
ncbi:MAG: galactokinase, partial [Oscillospiraceae bacterium]|nr:galactokinase [Oscillospiraceae bacterium]